MDDKVKSIFFMQVGKVAAVLWLVSLAKLIAALMDTRGVGVL
jgi:hypothetical protein